MSDADDDTAGGSRRERSTIKFPYGDLEDAVEISTGVQHWGHTSSLDQLAGFLNQTTTSGAFRTKLYSAVTFGVISINKGQVTLTDLGQRLVDPQRQHDALVDAFLGVPLYAHIVNTYRGGLLPSDAGIEQEMIRAGVASKVAPKARQAFQRSAEQAGFFNVGPDRLVEPRRSSSSVAAPSDAPTAAPARVSQPAGEPDFGELNPLLVGLIRLIPRDGSPFPPSKQRQWLEAARVNLGLIFGTDDESDVHDNSALFRVSDN